MGKPNIKRTERGWPGHHICAERCQFRRHTLLESGEVKIIISTVGRLRDYQANKFINVGCGRNFETTAWHAKYDGRYWDMDVERQFHFSSPWQIKELDAEDKANNMHEKVVEEIIEKLT